MGRGLASRITEEKDFPPWLFEKLKGQNMSFEEFLEECTEILKKKRANPKRKEEG